MKNQTLRNAQTGGLVRLFQHCSELERNYFAEKNDVVLTIAWNDGADQHVTIDGIKHELPSNTIVTLLANQSFEFEHPDWVIAWQFNREFYCIIDHDQEVSCAGLLFYGVEEAPLINLDEKEQRKVNLLYQVFLDEFADRDSLQADMMQMLLKRLIITVTRLYKKQNELQSIPAEELDSVRQYNLLVEKHFRKWHQVQDYANEMFKSPKTLSNLFKKSNSPSPLRVIHERIALEAKRLLIYTDHTVKEIAYELGFEEVPPFNRMFKKIVKETPSQFRKGMSNRPS
ncbi:MAG: helix-turn-helix domain-containing protein [Saprospiraceae bacterium]